MMNNGGDITMENALSATNAFLLHQLKKPNIVDLPRGFRAWRYLKDRIALSQNCTAGSKRLRSKLRAAQYLLYWYRQKDLREATGELCTWEMINFLRTA